MQIRFGLLHDPGAVTHTVHNKVELMHVVAREIGAVPNNLILNGLITRNTLVDNPVPEWESTYTLWYLNRALGYCNGLFEALPAS